MARPSRRRSTTRPSSRRSGAPSSRTFPAAEFRGPVRGWPGERLASPANGAAGEREGGTMTDVAAGEAVHGPPGGAPERAEPASARRKLDVAGFVAQFGILGTLVACIVFFAI